MESSAKRRRKVVYEEQITVKNMTDTTDITACEEQIDVIQSRTVLKMAGTNLMRERTAVLFIQKK